MHRTDTAAALPAPETPLSELATPALFLVNCLRLWLLRHLTTEPEVPDWREGFRVAGVPQGGALAFDGLLTLMTGRDLAELDLRCPNCPGLSLEEARLIALLAALQRGEEDLARALAGLWLPPALARLAMNPAGQLARALLAAGLPLQGCGVSQRVSAGRQGGDRGLRLVH